MKGNESETTDLQLTRLLKFDHVTLALQRAASRQENIFVIAIDVLRPSGKPGDCVVVLKRLPFSGHVGNRNGGFLSDVDGDVFGANTELEGGNSSATSKLTFIDGHPTFKAPFFGCSPRPRNRPGGSTLKFPTFSLRPSRRHAVYLASDSSFAFLSSFFSAVDIAFFLAFSPSKCSNMGRKSQDAKSVMSVPSRYSASQTNHWHHEGRRTGGCSCRTFFQSSKKFLLNVASCACSLSINAA